MQAQREIGIGAADKLALILLSDRCMQDGILRVPDIDKFAEECCVTPEVALGILRSFERHQLLLPIKIQSWVLSSDEDMDGYLFTCGREINSAPEGVVFA